MEAAESNALEMLAPHCLCCCRQRDVVVSTKKVFASGKWTVRNFQVYHYFVHKEESDRRQNTLLGIIFATLICLSVQANFCFIALFLDVSYAGTYVEYLMVAFQFLCFTPPIFLSNVDTIWQQSSLSSAADILSAFIAIGFLLIVGRGYRFYGALGLFGGIETVYVIEPFEMFLLLTFGRVPKYVLLLIRVGLVFFIVAVLVFRTAVYFRQIDIVNAVVLDVGRSEAITLREVWLFFVDILVVRLCYKSAERIERGEDLLFEAYKVLGEVQPGTSEHEGELEASV